MRIIRSLALICFMTSMMAFTAGHEPALVGSWNVVDVKAYLPGVSPRLIEGGKAEMLSTKFTFNKDSTCTKTSNFYAEGRNGKWRYIASEMIIEIHWEQVFVESGEYKVTDPAGIDSIHVQSITGDKMVWYEDMAELGNITYYLTRVAK